MASREGTADETGTAASALSATATVALRWRLAGDEDPVQADAECAASLRALEACLEGDGLRHAGGTPARLEAKVDLLLLAIDRLRHDGPVASAGSGRHRFLCCAARFAPGTVEWDDPLAPPVDDVAAILEIRAAQDHPVSALLPVMLSRRPAAATSAAADLAASDGVRMVATLRPMPPPVRDVYERCVFILHRQAVRRSAARPIAV